ncbi:uncharacterized protein LOC131439056 [Malaya genurostris]|uniref:uncharacterized protein LOC131439056 n=1 Tax=Malaya genurostris TaxID=325434 RepID=UPI0026F39BC7|nr:uncharacterized protein LOC131439056 [Malaya genurostris]
MGENSSSRKPCPICSKLDHRVRNCEEFRRFSLEARLKTVEENRLCETCLSNHGSWACKSRFSCNVANCHERHHPLLHRERAADIIKADCKTHRIVTESVLFRVVPITLSNGSRRIDTFAFLDEGSSHTLIDASITRQLGTIGISEPLQLVWTSDVSRRECASERVDLTISGRGGRKKYKLTAARTVNSLNLPTQNLRLDEISKQFEHLKDVSVTSYKNAKPKVLIGLQNLDLMTPIECRIGQPGEPIAVRSVLGWKIYGPCGGPLDENQFLGHHTCKIEADKELNKMIRQQFVLEDTGIAPIQLPESAEIVRARDILNKTTFRQNGRFYTGLLWKHDDIRLPDSLPMAVKRLSGFGSKLFRDPDLRRNVHQQIRDYIDKNYVHKATQEELSQADPNRVWYLPLNDVAHPKKPNKKRLVWDAAAKVKGVSLNSQLLKGPDLLVLLPGVICKFRERPVGFGGDIEKMFHQIRILPEDTHSQRFLFRFNEKLPPDVYMMDVATFGATCSPCSAQYVMHRNADENAHDFPEAAAAIKGKTYMDDYFDSTDTPEEALQRALQVKLDHSRGGMNMRNWVCNNVEILQGLGEVSEQRSLSIDYCIEDNRQRVLGIIWDPEKDAFIFSTNWKTELAPYVLDGLRPTKRIALRIIMSLFDPLGFLVPFFLHGRMLMQDLWRIALDWDAELGDVEYDKWCRWINLLPGISALEIPRCMFLPMLANWELGVPRIFEQRTEIA